MTNKNYKTATYTVEIEVAKPLTAVFDHFIDLSKWWPEDFEGESIGLNSEFVFSSGETHYSKNKVIEFIRNKKVVWLTTDSIRKTDNYDWTGTKFIFEFTPKADNTQLKFTYDGVVPEGEYDRLVQICNMTLKEMFYNYMINGKKNNQMEKKSYTVAIELTKSSHDVFKAITDDLVKWWGGKDFEGSSKKLNDEFIIHHPGTHYSKHKLVEVIPNKRIVWLVTASELNWLKDKHEWTNTKMIFEITVEGQKTQLRFTHDGLVPEKECYERCAHEGWDVVIKDRLFNFINTGKAI